MSCTEEYIIAPTARSFTIYITSEAPQQTQSSPGKQAQQGIKFELSDEEQFQAEKVPPTDTSAIRTLRNNCKTCIAIDIDVQANGKHDSHDCCLRCRNFKLTDKSALAFDREAIVKFLQNPTANRHAIEEKDLLEATQIRHRQSISPAYSSKFDVQPVLIFNNS
jgi:hypothetical protein